MKSVTMLDCNTQEQLDETAKRKGTHDARFSASTRVLEQLKAGIK